MTAKVYVVRDRGAIELIEKCDMDGLAPYVKEHPELDFGKEEFFWTKEADMAFCLGMTYGVYDRTGMAPYPLRDWEKPESRFMATIKRPDALEEIQAFQQKLNEVALSNRIFVVNGLTNHELGAS